MSGQTNITAKQMEEALHRSGYRLEARLEECLQSRGYYVDASPPVPDPKTAISREMDLYALYSIDDHDVDVFAVLLIECINSSGPIVFFCKDYSLGLNWQRCIRVAGSAPHGVDTPWAIRLRMDEYHHYEQCAWATQWCTFSLPKGNVKTAEWVACHDEARFTDISKLGTAVEYFSEKCSKRVAKLATHRPTLEVFYPILVIQGDMFDAKASPSGIDKALKHVVFSRSVALASGEETYLIDVVTEQHFPTLLDMIEKELKETTLRLSKEGSALQEAYAELGKS